MRIQADITTSSMVNLIRESMNYRMTSAQDIDKTLREHGITKHNAEELIEWCREAFQREAENSDANSYQDEADIRIYAEEEADDIAWRLEGSGTAYCTAGMRGDQYLQPDDPDEYSYSVSKAILEIYLNGDSDDLLGEWDITNLLEK